MIALTGYNCDAQDSGFYWAKLLATNKCHCKATDIDIDIDCIEILKCVVCDSFDVMR